LAESVDDDEDDAPAEGVDSFDEVDGGEERKAVVHLESRKVTASS
jgi:hypothetical protein